MEIHPQNYENSKSCVTYLSVRVRVEKETLQQKKQKTEQTKKKNTTEKKEEKKYRSTFNGKIGAETQKKKQKKTNPLQ